MNDDTDVKADTAGMVDQVKTAADHAYELGQYAARDYDEHNYVGTTKQIVGNDIHISCMKEVRNNLFKWPWKQDLCLYQLPQVLAVIPQPQVVVVPGNNYHVMPQVWQWFSENSAHGQKMDEMEEGRKTDEKMKEGQKTDEMEEGQKTDELEEGQKTDEMAKGDSTNGSKGKKTNKIADEEKTGWMTREGKTHAKVDGMAVKEQTDGIEVKDETGWVKGAQKTGIGSQSRKPMLMWCKTSQHCL